MGRGKDKHCRFGLHAGERFLPFRALNTQKPCLVDGQLFLERGIAGYKSALRMFDIAGLLLEKSRDRRLEFRPGVLLSVGSKKNFVSSTRLSTPEPAFS